MNTKRYVIAGAASIIIHSVFLSTLPNKLVMAMPVGTESTQVSLNLVSAPKPTPQSSVVQESVQKASPVSKPKPVIKETEVRKLVKQKKSEVVKEKPTKKVVKTTANKIVKQPEKRVIPKNTEARPPVSELQPEIKTQAASGVNNAPKLVSRPTFATRPSPVKYPSLAKRRGIEGQVTVELPQTETKTLQTNESDENMLKLLAFLQQHEIKATQLLMEEDKS